MSPNWRGTVSDRSRAARIRSLQQGYGVSAQLTDVASSCYNYRANNVCPHGRVGAYVDTRMVSATAHLLSAVALYVFRVYDKIISYKNFIVKDRNSYYKLINKNIICVYYLNSIVY